MRFPGSCEAFKYRLLDDYFPRRLYLLNDPNPPPSHFQYYLSLFY